MKDAILDQTKSPDGIKLGRYLKWKIKRTSSPSALLGVLKKSHCINWLDTKLIEVLIYNAYLSGAVELSPAKKLLEAYRTFLGSKKLWDVLPTYKETKTAYITTVASKFSKCPDEITVYEFLNHSWTTNIKEIVLDLRKGMLVIDLVRKGCLEIEYLIPTDYSFDAYKMAIHNRYNFYSIDLMHIKIGKHPLIYDPWFSDLEKHSAKQTQHHGKLSYSNNYVCTVFILRHYSFCRNVPYSAE